MYVPENPNQKPLDDVEALLGYQAEIDEQAYQDLCRRLFELDITPRVPSLFSVSYEDTRRWVYARGQQSGGAGSGANEYPVLRLVSNNLHRIEITDELELRLAGTGYKSVMDIDDFVIDLEQKGIIHNRSVVETIVTPEGEKWPILSWMAPLILPGAADEMILHVGESYETKEMPSKALMIKDSFAIGSLLLALNEVKDWRDDDITVRPVRHTA